MLTLQISSTKLFNMHLMALAITLFAYTSSFALDPNKSPTQYVQDIWSAREGLHHTVLSIAQTPDGYLWLGTSTGLVRFDGVNFTPLNETISPQMPSKGIWELYVARDGSLWICSWKSGLHRYKDGKFKKFTKKDGLPIEEVRTVYEDREGAIWIGTLHSGVCRLKEGKMTHFTPKDGLCGNDIKSIIDDEHGNLWLASYDGGLCRFKDGKFKTYSIEDGLPTTKVRESFKDRSGTLWFGTLAGLVKLKDEKFTTYTTKDGLSNDRIFPIREDKHGNLWVGTEGGGLNRFRDGRFISYTAKDGFTDDDVKSIFEDKEGSLWIGTMRGLTRLKDGNFVTLTTREGLVNDSIRTVHQDWEGSLWFGTVKGLSRYRDGKFTTYTTKDGLSNNAILSLAEGHDESLWIGTHAGGLSQFKNGKFKSYKIHDATRNDVITAIHRGSNGVMWIGSELGALFSFENGHFIRHTKDESYRAVRAIAEDNRGAVWIGATFGTKRIHKGEISQFTSKDGLPDNQVNVIYRDKKDTLWFGTSSGLAVLIDNKFKQIKQGLHDTEIFQIFEDEADNMWFGSFNGVFRVTRKELLDSAEGKIPVVRSVAYGVQDGLKNLSCAHPAHQLFGFKDKEGRIWFPTHMGVSMVNPRSITSNKTPPPVIVESFRDSKTRIELSPTSLSTDHSNVEFHYTGVSLLQPEKVKFKYKLEGFDTEWIDAGARRVAYYTNLQPGNYRFRVIACNNDGVWNESGASVSFSLSPPFYETGWFKLLFVLCIVFIGFSQYRKREETVPVS
jgi:ligand-binding sensor domain-containing protein